MPDNTFVLKVIAGPLSGKEVPVDRTVSVGRFGTDIVIQDEKLSRRHASLDVEGHALVVRDHDSTNGTFVNGLRVTGPMPVGDGDIVTLGETQLEVSIPWAGEGDSNFERTQTEELSRPAPVVVSGVAKPKGFGIVAAAVIIAIGLVAAAVAFMTSEDIEGSGDASQEDGGSQGGSSMSEICRRADRKAKQTHAARPASRKRWVGDVRRARRLRARTLATLVERGLAERGPAFVAAFRRTDSSLLRLQNALDSQSSPSARNKARREVLARSRFEARMAKRVGLPRCGELAI